MKIWLVHHYAIPPSEAGVTRHYQLLYELKKRGHEPVLIAADRNHRNPSKFALSREQNLKLDRRYEVPILWLRANNNSASPFKRVVNMLVFAKRIWNRQGLNTLDKPDLIIGCTPDLFSALAVQRLAKAYNIPFVFHLGELWPLMLTSLGGIPKYHPFIILLDKIEKYLYRKASGIIAAQEFANKHIDTQGGTSAQYTYIPNGVDLNKCLPSNEVALKPLKGNKKFIIMYIGAMGNANGVDEVLDAASLVKNSNIEFHLMGDGPFRCRLKHRINDENLKNIKLLPPVARNQIYNHMKSADAFIVNIPDKKPYEYGLAHNKVFDYMAMARPTIIATNTSDNPITEYKAGILVPSNDAREMARAADRLSESTFDFLSSMGANARKGVEEKYNFSKQGNILNEALLKIAGQQS